MTDSLMTSTVSISGWALSCFPIFPIYVYIYICLGPPEVCNTQKFEEWWVWFRCSCSVLQPTQTTLAADITAVQHLKFLPTITFTPTQHSHVHDAKRGIHWSSLKLSLFASATTSSQSQASTQRASGPMDTWSNTRLWPLRLRCSHGPMERLQGDKACQELRRDKPHIY